MEIGDVNWRSLWRELTSKGWKARPPRGIESDYRYVPPSGNARGVEGTDYFLGTTAVISHYLEELQSSAGERDSVRDQKRPSSAGVDVSGAESSSLGRLTEPGMAVNAESGGLKDLRAAGAPVRADSSGDGGDTGGESAEDISVDEDSVAPGAEHDASSDEESKTESTVVPQPRTLRRRALRMSVLPETAIVDEDDERDNGEVDELASSLNIVAPGEDPADFEVFDSGDDPIADDFDKHQEIDDSQMLVVNDNGSESGSENSQLDTTEASETRFNEEFLRALGEHTALTSGSLNSNALRELGVSGYELAVAVDVDSILKEPYVPVRDADDYPGLKDSYFGPNAAIKKAGETPLALFMFFMPLTLWRDIATESNLYHLSMIGKRADAQFTRHKRKYPSSDKSRASFKAALQQLRPIQPVELLHMIGLLLARAIQPNKERLSHHWTTHDEGGISRGLFGTYMARDLFFHIMRNLHFSDKSDERSRTDRIWKIGPVVDVLQRTFKSGYVPPPRLSFDEGMLPSFSSFNKTLIYLKAKPHKWGTKMFLTCCAESAYYLRFEIYVGRKQLASEQPGTESSAMPEGPATVVRNMRTVLGSAHPEHYLVVTDRFYTCAALAIQLMAMSVYLLVTALPTRLGFCKAIVPPSRQKPRPRGMTRGAHTVAVCKSVPEMKACIWSDNKPVLFLTTGGSEETEQII